MKPAASAWALLGLVSFLASTTTRADDFTVVIFGDTQNQIRVDPSTADPETTDPANEQTFEIEHAGPYEAFKKMVEWVTAQLDPEVTDPQYAEPIQLVVHVGDAIQHGTNDPNLTEDLARAAATEWLIFDYHWQRIAAMVPTIVVRGNHDDRPGFDARYGDPDVPGRDGRSMRVTLGGRQVLVVGLVCNPSQAQLAWAHGLLEAESDTPALIVSHIVTRSDGMHVPSPEAAVGAACNGNPPSVIWNEIVAAHPAQVRLVASGHFGSRCTGEWSLVDGSCNGELVASPGFKALRHLDGSPVLDTLQNWQRYHLENSTMTNGNGFLTLLRFKNQSDPGAARVEVLAWDAVTGVDVQDPDDPGFDRDPNHEGVSWLAEQPFHLAIPDLGCPSQCGDGDLDAVCGEACDDGNTGAGDCCDGSCQVEPTGTSCDDGDACTSADECDGAGACVGADEPASSCKSPGRSVLLIRGGPLALHDSLAWKWLDGGATTLGELGDPIGGGAGFTLCIYDRRAGTASIVLRRQLPAGGVCSGRPCWRTLGATGYHYADPELTPDGIQRAVFRSGEAGAAGLIVRGRGDRLGIPDLPLDVDPSLTVQLHASSGACFAATYSEASSENGASRFRGKLP